MSPRAVQAREQLEQQLSDAQATIEALLSDQIDAVIDVESKTPVLLNRAQAALRESEERSQRYLDTATVMLLALDIGGRVELVNRYACSVLGWKSEELVGRDWIATCVPERLRAAMHVKFGNLVAGDLVVVETPICTKWGDERLIEWRNTVQRDAAGQVTGTLSSGIDITDRNRAEDALRATEQRMRFALQNADVGIWDMDFRAGTVRWSEILERQYGLEPGTFGGTLKEFIARVHPDDRATVGETIEAAMKSGKDFSVQSRTIWPDGTVRWLRGAGRFQIGPRGETGRGVGISQDVTERRAFEARYQQSSKMEAVGQLAAGVAHDFNNLLTVIIGFTELVAAGESETGTHKEELTEILSAAMSAAGLTKQLLAFSRQQVLHGAPLDVNGLIMHMTGLLRRLIGEHIEIVMAPAPALALAFADRGQLEQVVMNLVVNARDAMPDGGRVTIATQEVTLGSGAFQSEAAVPGKYIRLSITDTGTGMTEDTHLRLFEPFFTTKATGKGTGLGLSTTYGIVKQSKGYIDVDSHLGVGTTFNVYLPRAKENAEEPDDEPALVAPATRASETVLLVEDEAGVRRLSRRILENAGYVVLEAADGSSAESVFAAHAGTIDLLVTDIVMPRCGGPELLRRLQRTAPALRVLYMSGYTNQSTAQQAEIDAGLPFVQKPFTAAEFERRVRAVLD